MLKTLLISITCSTVCLSMPAWSGQTCCKLPNVFTPNGGWMIRPNSQANIDIRFPYQLIPSPPPTPPPITTAPPRPGTAASSVQPTGKSPS